MPSERYGAWKRLLQPRDEASIQTTHELLYRNYIELLTFKSPMWKYEGEVWMIYEKSTLNPKEDFGESTFACPFCDKVCRSKDQCKRPLHRDTVKIPEATILGIVIGTDCPSNFLNPILKLLEETRYKHVKIYWATLHPAEYRMNYLEVDASAIKAYQDDHSERIGRAKNHFTYTKDGGTMPPYGAQKRINFYPVRKEALPEEPPSELA